MQAQHTAGAPVTEAVGRTAGKCGLAAVGAGAPTFGDRFSVSESLGLFISGMAGGGTLLMLLLSYKPITKSLTGTHELVSATIVFGIQGSSPYFQVLDHHLSQPNAEMPGDAWLQ